MLAQVGQCREVGDGRSREGVAHGEACRADLGHVATLGEEVFTLGAADFAEVHRADERDARIDGVVHRDVEHAVRDERFVEPVRRRVGQRRAVGLEGAAQRRVAERREAERVARYAQDGLRARLGHAARHQVFQSGLGQSLVAVAVVEVVRVGDGVVRDALAELGHHDLVGGVAAGAAPAHDGGAVAAVGRTVTVEVVLRVRCGRGVGGREVEGLGLGVADFEGEDFGRVLVGAYRRAGTAARHVQVLAVGQREDAVAVLAVGFLQLPEHGGGHFAPRLELVVERNKVVVARVEGVLGVAAATVVPQHHGFTLLGQCGQFFERSCRRTF